MPQTAELLRGGVIRMMANTVAQCLSLHSSLSDVMRGGCVMVTLHFVQVYKHTHSHITVSPSKVARVCVSKAAARLSVFSVQKFCFANHWF